MKNYLFDDGKLISFRNIGKSNSKAFYILSLNRRTG